MHKGGKGPPKAAERKDEVNNEKKKTLLVHDSFLLITGDD